MSSRCQRASRSAGFTLVEVLVAVAIAAMLAAMLVRFVAGTRLIASRIGEALQMEAIAETLLARVFSEPGLQPGRTDGQAAPFLWRIEVKPTTFTARTLREQRPPASAETGFEEALVTAAVKLMKSNAENARPAASFTSTWIAYRVVVAVESPSGRKHVVDTITIKPQPATGQR